MAGYYNPQSNPGLFVQTTAIWDVDKLYSIDITKPEFKELLVRLYHNINNITLALNLKDSGYYDVQEFLNSQLFFPNPSLDAGTATTPTYRQVFRMVVNFGVLPNTATKSVAHNIAVTSTAVGPFTFTRIYGCATNSTQTSFIPLPYASTSAVASNIELNADATNVNIITGSDRSAFTTCYVILEYIKQ